ncbi:MAG: hypothetical protein ACI4MA_04560 [Treponema sp.]
MTEEKLGLDAEGSTGKKLLGYHDFIAAIVTALESRDLYTEFHSMRVADMSQQICAFLGVDSGFSEIVHIAASVLEHWNMIVEVRNDFNSILQVKNLSLKTEFFLKFP